LISSKGRYRLPEAFDGGDVGGDGPKEGGGGGERGDQHGEGGVPEGVAHQLSQIRLSILSLTKDHLFDYKQAHSLGKDCPFYCFIEPVWR
jgi:hypothetical protein